MQAEWIEGHPQSIFADLNMFRLYFLWTMYYSGFDVVMLFTFVFLTMACAIYFNNYIIFHNHVEKIHSTSRFQ